MRKPKSPIEIAKEKAIKETFMNEVRKRFDTEICDEYKFHPVRKWKSDYAMLEYMIIVEVEGAIWTGGRHTSGMGFVKDMEKYNEISILGWILLRVTPTDLNKESTFDFIRRANEYRKQPNVY